MSMLPSVKAQQSLLHQQVRTSFNMWVQQIIAQTVAYSDFLQSWLNKNQGQKGFIIILAKESGLSSSIVKLNYMNQH